MYNNVVVVVEVGVLHARVVVALRSRKEDLCHGASSGFVIRAVTFEAILSTQTHILRAIFAVVVVLLLFIHNTGRKPSIDNNIVNRNNNNSIFLVVQKK